jgi:hypothetical protein
MKPIPPDSFGLPHHSKWHIEFGLRPDVL